MRRVLTYALVAGILPLTAGAAAPAIANDPVCDIRQTGQRGGDHLCGIERLGPWPLPDREPMPRLLRGYTPLGRSVASTFELKWSNGTHGWRYPPFHGFAVETFPSFTLVVKTPLWLQKGEYVDRFGPPSGSILNPAGTPFARRSLPPDALNDAPAGYHCYRVDRPVKVVAGPVRPWFGQPGRGRQYYLGYGTHGEPLTGDRAVTVSRLAQAGYLHEVGRTNPNCAPATAAR